MRSICGNCLDKRKGENYEVNLLYIRFLKFIFKISYKIIKIFYEKFEFVDYCWRLCKNFSTHD